MRCSLKLDFYEQVHPGLQPRCMSHLSLKGPARHSARMQKSVVARIGWDMLTATARTVSLLSAYHWLKAFCYLKQLVVPVITRSNSDCETFHTERAGFVWNVIKMSRSRRFPLALPLSLSERWGWLLTMLGSPCVAQRVWAMPKCVKSSSSRSSESFSGDTTAMLLNAHVGIKVHENCTEMKLMPF